MPVQQPYIPLQTIWVSRPDGTALAEAIRVIERDTYENRVLVKFSKGIPEEERRPVREVLSRNISMFGKGTSGGVLLLHFKKGTIEQWVFAAIELERRGYKVRRDDSTRTYTREFVAMHVNGQGNAVGNGAAVRTPKA